MKKPETIRVRRAMLATDALGSILYHQTVQDIHRLAYSVYGYDPIANLPFSQLGFNGQAREPNGLYSLGNGYRFYSTLLMRFVSPDDLSPFSRGGINAYGYCEADPVNASDKTGHSRTLLIERFKIIKRQPQATVVPVGKNKFKLQTWQPKSTFSHEAIELQSTVTNLEAPRYVKSIDRLNFDRNMQQIASLKLALSSKMRVDIPTVESHIKHLENINETYLARGAELMRQAADSDDLTTYFKGEPRTTRGGFRLPLIVISEPTD
ncbi:RHS repeat-associated core domain-containing protein [Pseudomonas sp. RC3H12]|uniref:RHS repeat-associated core domain-containing protein n=1 Tax=Pseudomonas sp. RC3H12 TaxID=2834406 RepID=UPI001BDEF4FE|nr:RHS repeat-associated core domain-containing protein [Pseudomonas sp. RC3H12]QWA31299.1 RHS repeat-associated core domain-containing protein [Pseudomonas sp. RC3H12]